MSDETAETMGGDTQERRWLDPETRQAAGAMARAMWALELRGQGLETTKEAWDAQKRDYALKAARILSALKKYGYTMTYEAPSEKAEDVA
jgi:hypothetical protein